MRWHILLYMVQCIPKLMFGFPLPFVGAYFFFHVNKVQVLENTLLSHKSVLLFVYGFTPYQFSVPFR